MRCYACILSIEVTSIYSARSPARSSTLGTIIISLIFFVVYIKDFISFSYYLFEETNYHTEIAFPCANQLLNVILSYIIFVTLN